jgi:hypothetical protein
VPTLEELKAAMQAADQRVRSLETASQELVAARADHRAASSAYYKAERVEAFARVSERLIGRTIGAIEHDYQDAPRASTVYRGFEVLGMRLVLDDGTRVSAEDNEGDDANFLIELPKSADAVDPHADSTGKPSTRV